MTSREAFEVAILRRGLSALLGIAECNRTGYHRAGIAARQARIAELTA